MQQRCLTLEGRISIAVTGETTDGFEVRITLGTDMIFGDSFESGDLSGWS